MSLKENLKDYLGVLERKSIHNALALIIRAIESDPTMTRKQILKLLNCYFLSPEKAKVNSVPKT